MTNKEKWLYELIYADFALTPLKGRTKIPLEANWQHTMPDPFQDAKDFPANFGVVIRPEQDMRVLDVDPRNYKNDVNSLDKLFNALNITDIDSYTVQTGGGGQHIYLLAPVGIDLRETHPGYPGLELKGPGKQVVGPGSIHPDTGHEYTVLKGKPSCLAKMPQGLVELFSRQPRTQQARVSSGIMVDDEPTRQRYRKYLETAPIAIQGDRGDATTYLVACSGRDFGLTQDATLEEMLEYWNDRCSPPWKLRELAGKVENAYKYAQNESGSRHPSVDFRSSGSGSAMAFPIEALPLAFRQYAEAVADALQCPIDYIGCALLAVTAILSGGKVRVQIASEWHQFGNLFIALVGTPAAKKSPALDKGLELLKPIEQALYAIYQNEMALYELQMLEYEAEKQTWKKNRESSPPKAPQKPKLQRLTSSDATVEALCDVLSNNPHGLGLTCDELASWLRSMNQYKSKGGSDRSQYLSMWNNASITVDRKGKEPLYIPSPYLTVIGGIQPDVLYEMKKTDAMNDGFIERILFCCPARRTDLPQKGKAIPDNIRSAIYKAVDTLFKGRTTELTTIPLTAEAEDEFLEAQCDWHVKIHSDDFPRSMEAFVVKMANHLGRFALLINQMKKASDKTLTDEIDRDTLQKAKQLADYFLNHVYHALHFFQQDTRQQEATELAQWIIKKGYEKVSPRMIQQSFKRKYPKASQARDMLKLLDDYGHGTWNEQENSFTPSSEV